MTAYFLFIEYLLYYTCNIYFVLNVWMYCILIKEALLDRVSKLKILKYYSSFKLYVVKPNFLHSPNLSMSKDWQLVNLMRLSVVEIPPSPLYIVKQFCDVVVY